MSDPVTLAVVRGALEQITDEMDLHLIRAALSPIISETNDCAHGLYDAETGETIAFCRFEQGVQEIFAVEVLPGVRFPDLVNHDAEIVGHSYVLGDDALADVPDELRS